MFQEQSVSINPPLFQEASKTPSINQILSGTSDAQDATDLLCFSHLRWNFVYQRPQHLLSRASQQRRVWFVEEPIFGDTERTEVRLVSDSLTVIVPHLKHGTPHDDVIQKQRNCVDELLAQHQIHEYITWYYTPMALSFSGHLTPQLTIYDCMDELSAFLGAPASLLEQEKELLNRADLVFTGGLSLYEAKRSRHPQVFAFPSSIDYAHFEPARHNLPAPADIESIAGPRVGFCGVIDERMNVRLLGELAQNHPNWQFVLLGPIVKIDPDTLPKAANVHYLGMKSYEELPGYFSQWNVAMMPFAINQSTKYISPTKTPEYLAAGLPVVSTPIRDVVTTYGGWSPVLIADHAAAFGEAIENALTGQHIPDDWAAVDNYLLEHSWDATWTAMNQLMQAQLSGVAQEN